MRNGRQLTIGNNLGLIHFKNEKEESSQQEMLHAIQELHAIFPFELAKRQPGDPEDHLPFAIYKARLAGIPTEKKPVIGGQG